MVSNNDLLFGILAVKLDLISLSPSTSSLRRTQPGRRTRNCRWRKLWFVEGGFQPKAAAAWKSFFAGETVASLAQRSPTRLDYGPR